MNGRFRNNFDHLGIFNGTRVDNFYTLGSINRLAASSKWGALSGDTALKTDY